ncbi:MAG: hypothetical protein KIT33_00860 [Candidatus Kapabacteria bacterium]|nr:hypothetical protein [Ignavibacteriota bacterium]MCW5883497.1 hypothetical protein [Candidatus Kapabacteria bacterium]
MKIKKFIAKDIKEGKRLVIEELGDEAVILSNRVFKDPENGEELVEIVAAIDETVGKSKPSESKSVKDTQISNIRQMSKAIGSHSNELILNEIDTLKDMINQLADSIKFRNIASLGSHLSKLYKRLRNLEISDDQSLRIVNRISESGGVNDYREALYEARKILVEGIDIGKSLQKSAKSNIVLFIGTTGSGKTATLVKLAILSKIVQNANNLIVSADTYKVGASEQLETYASIASIPFRSAFTNDELKKIIDENQNKDFIFVDTTGFSQKNNEQIEQIHDLINTINPNVIYLTIPAVVSATTADSIFNGLKGITIDSVILTKADESESIANMIQTIKPNKVPISYITNGIKIPEDIQPADRVLLGKLSLLE